MTDDEKQARDELVARLIVNYRTVQFRYQDMGLPAEVAAQGVVISMLGLLEKCPYEWATLSNAMRLFGAVATAADEIEGEFRKETRRYKETRDNGRDDG